MPGEFLGLPRRGAQNKGGGPAVQGAESHAFDCRSRNQARALVSKPKSRLRLLQELGAHQLIRILNKPLLGHVSQLQKLIELHLRSQHRSCAEHFPSFGFKPPNALSKNLLHARGHVSYLKVEGTFIYGPADDWVSRQQAFYL